MLSRDREDRFEELGSYYLHETLPVTASQHRNPLSHAVRSRARRYMKYSLAWSRHGSLESVSDSI